MRELISEYQFNMYKIADLNEKITSIYTAAISPKIKNISGMPMAPGFSKGGLENTFIRIEELNEQIQEYKTKCEKIAATIESKLDVAGVNDIGKTIFWYREVYCLRWREIGVLTKKSIRQSQRIYQKAIYNVMLL